MESAKKTKMRCIYGIKNKKQTPEIECMKWETKSNT
jgi:hypothetical protein